MMNGRWIFFLIGVTCCMACNESKYLQKGEQLYAGNTIRVQSSMPISKKETKAIQSGLEGLLRPRLNSKILGRRFKLWVYNVAGTPKGKGLRYWLKNKVGEPPVLATGTILEKNRDIMQNRLENRGFFFDTVILGKKLKDKELTAVYTAQIGNRYTYRNITYPTDTGVLNVAIDSLQKRSLLKKGDPYDLDRIKDERTRIDTRLKQRGYYYFSPDFLLADVDTTVGNHQLDLRLHLKRWTPARAQQPYYIDHVTVFANYDISQDSASLPSFMTPEGYRIIDTAHLFRPVIYRRTLVFRPGSLYRSNDHNLSLSRLVSLGVFKFVKARFDPVDTPGSNKLNVYYYLTPSPRKSIRFEASGLTRSDNTIGSLLSINWQHRNLLRGAEQFKASIYGGIEQQNAGGGVTTFTNRLGINLSLVVPRLIPDLKLFGSNAFVPKTKIAAGYELFHRSDQYTLNSARVSFGYIFKDKITNEHQLTVLGINYVSPSNITPSYQLGLDTNVNLRRSIERQFIIGPSYNFNYNSQARPNRRMNNFYFNGNVDLSGNVLGWITGANINKGREKEIFGTPFSQYVRLEADFRHYLSFSRDQVLVSRVTGGIGISYGNSSTMPFIKEFFGGGPNDIRAFRSRALGPGSYYGGDRKTTPNLPDQPGDIKLEMNLEYRAKLFSILRWAIFADMGNIWTLRADTSRPGSTFSSSFLKDVAVGAGTGLRFDFSILILRIDMAVPLRSPWLPAGSQWRFSNAGDISKYVLNLAIGYPF